MHLLVTIKMHKALYSVPAPDTAPVVSDQSQQVQNTVSSALKARQGDKLSRVSPPTRRRLSALQGCMGTDAGRHVSVVTLCSSACTRAKWFGRDYSGPRLRRRSPL